MRGPTKFQHMRGVMLKQDKLQCGLCHRQHDTRASAQSCVYQCLIKRNSPQPVKKIAERKLQAFRCTYCCREYPQLTQANQCVSSCVNDYRAKIKRLMSEESALFACESAVEVQPEEAGPATVESNQKETPVVVLEDDKFFRDQAKYACKTCGKAYFSKEEVLTCFDSHAR